MDTFDVILTARSNTDLKPEEFERQKAMIKPVMEWDPSTSTWRTRISSSRAEQVGNVINTLFEAAREYGTVVTVRLVPADQADATVASD
ncbi:hypothetical protein AB0F17_35145 [Nonomuraea sp. NPDC026600]|uniref:hypothetical protein n=1 Tax=Nonomuraea sp. NPDC026600 TaxID=3155363 RepID=UPI0033CE95C8